MDLYLEEINSPLGRLSIVTDGEALRAIEFDDYPGRLERFLQTHCGDYVLHSGPSSKASVQLLAYFSGQLTALDTLPVQTAGTLFQRRVWEALRRIPPGTTLSYGALASQIGTPLASRAVGMANSVNPIPIVVPCHRVIGANGKLTGFSGGMERKRWLLAHEAKHASPPEESGQQRMW